MTRRQRYFLGHFIAWGPLLLVAIYVAYFKVGGHDVPWYVGILAVFCAITFFVGIIFRDKSEDKPHDRADSGG